nr:MAG TPA: hypothetical protein [Caudoviricetes sp.]
MHRAEVLRASAFYYLIKETKSQTILLNRKLAIDENAKMH